MFDWMEGNLLDVQPRGTAWLRMMGEFSKVIRFPKKYRPSDKPTAHCRQRKGGGRAGTFLTRYRT
ncbi:hypothetical protein B0H19DRAFT_1087879 [Mycena capillaripes]|nr:hypothetical protein B0H19DRAFT_1087879 [Mycena capillaripes]